MNNSGFKLLELLLPKEILNYFEIKDISTKDGVIYIDLYEKNIPPEEYSNMKLKPVGYSNSSVIHDFPIREKAVFLKIHRRKWFLEDENKYVQRDWNLTFKGTKLTEEFGSFLKDTNR